ncbi:MAG: hypothetical protein WBO44_10445 [Saprospiraceae bacterium]
MKHGKSRFYSTRLLMAEFLDGDNYFSKDLYLLTERIKPNVECNPIEIDLLNSASFKFA